MPPDINARVRVLHRHLSICNIIRCDRAVARAWICPAPLRPGVRHRRHPRRRHRGLREAGAPRWICPDPLPVGTRRGRRPRRRRPGRPVRRPLTSMGRARPRPFRPRGSARPDHRPWISGRPRRNPSTRAKVRHPWISGRRRRPRPRPGVRRRWICRRHRPPVQRPSRRRGSPRLPPGPRCRPAGFPARRKPAGRRHSGRNPGRGTVCPRS